MNTFFRTTIVLLAVNLITAGFAPARDEQEEAARTEAEAVRTEIEVRETRKQVDAEREQIEELKARIKELQNQERALGELVVPASAPMPEIRIPSFTNSMLGSRDSGGSILVIPSAQMSAEDILAMNEDMTVMSRILRQQLNQEAQSHRYYMGRFDPFRWHNSGMPESMYLEGYGALFLIKVDFPLSPPEQEAEEEEETEQEDVDLVWEQTRQDIYEPHHEERGRRRRAKDSEQQYDAEKVEGLKASLIKVLKHASNIRGLQQDESVILTIIGSGESSHGHTVIVSRKVTVNGEKTNVIGTPTSVDTGIPAPIMLVIRTKKSDIYDFANDDIDLAQFRERIQVLTCPYFSEGTGAATSVSVVRSSRRGTGESRARSSRRPGISSER